MESSVYFKFKSQKEPTRVEFDGTGISVFELKRDIILKSGLGDGTDFDLAIYTEDGNEEYDDDTTIIPRSTTVVARRLPPMKPGAGRAARYVSGKMPSHAKNHSRREQAAKAAVKSQSDATQQMHNAMTEEEKLAAMFKAQSDVLATNEEELARTAPVFRPTNKKAANVPDHDPPNGYICYRCGEKGHWIMLCPTNDNPEYDNRPRVKRTTGIPRSFLKTVDKSTALGQNGDDEAAKPPTGLMVNADGEFVVAEPDKASWAQFQAKAKNAASKEAAQDGDKDLQERGLECSIDKKMFLDPMKTPCCEKTYCNECITNALIVSDFVCPNCQSDGVLLDDLKQDNETAEKIKDYLAARDKAKEEKAAKESRSAQAKSPASERAEVAKVDKEEIKATADSSKKTSTTANIITKSPAEQKTDPKNVDKSNLKKRPADELLENPRIPKGPKAMQQQSHSNMNNMMGMNGMNGMPMMPLGMNMNFPMPMMPMNMYGNFPNMMGGMNGFSNGGGSFNGINGGNMGMGMPSMNTMSNMNGGGDFVGNGGGMNGNQAYRNGGYSNGGFNNYHGGNQQWRKFNNPQHNEEEDAYFRKPVNPHRHQNRIRRTRPSDYREL